MGQERKRVWWWWGGSSLIVPQWKKFKEAFSAAEKKPLMDSSSGNGFNGSLGWSAVNHQHIFEVCNTPHLNSWEPTQKFSDEYIIGLKTWNLIEEIAHGHFCLQGYVTEIRKK